MTTSEYYGHDTVLRVRPESGGLPELVVRVTGGNPLEPGHRVGLRVRGTVTAWPATTDRSGAVDGATAPDDDRRRMTPP